ncbi:TPA: hypothetical protein ACH3X1_009854 [Trebouxia sp. C0004]
MSAEKEWVKVKILFPGCAGKSDEAQTKQISNLMNRMTSQIEGWDKDKVTGLMRKTCVAETRAAGASSSQVDLHSGWINCTQDRNYARASLQATMDVITTAAGFTKDFREHHYLGRAELPVPKAWYNALLPGLTPLLDTVSSLLKYGPDIQLKQVTAVQDVMDTDAYAIFTTKVGQAELDSTDKLGLQVPYLSDRADKQAPSKRLAEGLASIAEPAAKRQRVELCKETAEPGSALAGWTW